MVKQQMTDEQKYWHLKGYLECFIDDLTIDMKITKPEAKKIVAGFLSDVIDKSK